VGKHWLDPTSVNCIWNSFDVDTIHLVGDRAGDAIWNDVGRSASSGRIARAWGLTLETM
jgi:hypothetical protein